MHPRPDLKRTIVGHYGVLIVHRSRKKCGESGSPGGPPDTSVFVIVGRGGRCGGYDQFGQLGAAEAARPGLGLLQLSGSFDPEIAGGFELSLKVEVGDTRKTRHTSHTVLVHCTLQAIRQAEPDT